MSFITREDGVRFVIPSYRDTLSAKKPALLKKQVLLQSENHGNYVALQRKSVDQYEIAFSNEPGYLLGESVWNYFKRPQDLIYCEAIPNTSEAILVIVKAGSVYLDGSFHLDSVMDELIVFRTQQSNFNIYIYGDVPISQEQEEDKFSLDSSSVQSFNVLEKPIFPTLPTIKTFQLQQVETVLRAQGIGVFPTKKLLIVFALVAALWFGFKYITTATKQALPPTLTIYTNPMQAYSNALATPEPSQEIKWLAAAISSLFSIDGWVPMSINYANGLLSANMLSQGAQTKVLFAWAAQHNARIEVAQSGFVLSMGHRFENRPKIDDFSLIVDVVGNISDRISTIIQGNSLSVGKVMPQHNYNQMDLTIRFDRVTPSTLDLIGQQLSQLPVNLSSVTVSLQSDGNISGSINLKVLGN